MMQEHNHRYEQLQKRHQHTKQQSHIQVPFERQQNAAQARQQKHGHNSTTPAKV
jgi:hypothetical protein